ncbi:hypothetical protein HWV07_10550 [Natronomonas salina]|uniref:DUF6789 family protein n=1 Tax=Natronomonas salina TaxID=1710540 RepID=UPI0015B3ADCB|nr:DUF6789 family protein [Natronomonas salina]QLD89445.1 hypothetical protein HWV07_10550 [Natronomonas salina]
MSENDGAVANSPTERDADLDARLDITPRVVLVSFLGGAAGLLAMVPVLFALPALLGLFRAEPLVEVAELGRVLGVEPSLALGAVVFALGGVVALPLLFVVAAAFLPPREPRYARGITFATIMWTGFVIAFWPGEYAGVIFLGVSLAAHWAYGYVLGRVTDHFAHISQHTI